jgi:hypothetical protein
MDWNVRPSWSRPYQAPIFLCVVVSTPQVVGYGWTAAGEPTNEDARSIAGEVLAKALDDERRAIAFYEAVIERFGDRTPFSNIVHAERRHAAALLEQYARLEIDPPPDRWQTHKFSVPPTFQEACDMAEISEIKNAAMYDDLIASVQDESIRQVFRQRRNASQERHLQAFRRHSNGWKQISQSDLSSTQKAQRERAVQAKAEMFGRLMRRLQTELSSVGPAGAIEVCKSVAPQVAMDVGKATGVQIGRTSWKLRNPANTGPAWTGLVLHDRPTAPRVVVARDGRIGATLPITVASPCLKCHGDRESIPPAVRTKLREEYPNDQAVGFREGDLRGWFWVEVPPPGK